MDNVDRVVGRGWLPEARPGKGVEPALTTFVEGEVHLRLERTGDLVRGLCSVDGSAWFSVGQVELVGVGSLQVGLYANGDIDRLIYPGAYPDGTAIRFRSFEMWGPATG
jgi:hypothetical protein